MASDENGFHMHGRDVPHPKRKYREKQQRGLKDVDSAARVRNLKILLYSFPGGVGGALGGGFIGVGAIPGFIVGFLIVFLVTRGLTESAGAAAGAIYHPSGKSTPKKREYSYAESLAARGRYEEAVVAYEVGISEFPEDPEPYIRIARLQRDKLADYEQAAHWFKRARQDAEISMGQELVVTQELIEIYGKKLDQPTRSIPELARILDRFPDDQVADWASTELARLREIVAERERERSE